MLQDVLYLRKYNVPFQALSYCFGENAMKWYRMEQSLGQNSIVGTTIRWIDDLPLYCVADEKHTWVLGEKAYIAGTNAENCFFGTPKVKSADEADLTVGYGIYKPQAIEIQPDYTPKTVTTDGWLATKNAWKTLFSSYRLIAGFLHIYIKVRDQAKKKYSDIFSYISGGLWNCL